MLTPEHPLIAGATGAIYIIAPALICLVGYFVVLPLIAGGKFTQQRGTRRPPVTRDSGQIPDFAAAYFDGVEADLAPLGFAFEAAMADERLSVGNVVLYCAFFTNRTRRETARAVVARSDVTEGVVRPPACLLAFVMETEDGSIMTVDNSASPTLYSKPPYRSGACFPGLQDISTLYQLFREECVMKGLRPKPVPPAHELVRLHDLESDRDIDWNVQAGHMYDAGGGAMRLTLMCKILRVSLLMPPLPKWRLAMKRSRARTRLRALGFPADSLEC